MKRKSVTICGIPYKIKEVRIIDEKVDGIVQGEIGYTDTTIRLRKDLKQKAKEAVLYHEILHGMLVHLGYNDLSENETFVQGLSNAMFQMFDLKEK